MIYSQLSNSTRVIHCLLYYQYLSKLPKKCYTLRWNTEICGVLHNTIKGGFIFLVRWDDYFFWKEELTSRPGRSGPRSFTNASRVSRFAIFISSKSCPFLLVILLNLPLRRTLLDLNTQCDYCHSIAVWQANYSQTSWNILVQNLQLYSVADQSPET